ncbi:MAG: hypothetical protein ACRECO_08600 [Xanthobacteraceae bacterium]
MPLQNRVDPFGELICVPARGLFMGNRGGRFHTDKRTLTRRRWASRQWICCVLDFKSRHRQVWECSYTELFFADEATALAAGHRPCFECRRNDATLFAAAWQRAFELRTAPSAGMMDGQLHAERLDGREKRLHRRGLDDLPDGAFVAIDGSPFAVRGDSLLRWTPAGYDACRSRPRALDVGVLTPPGVLAVLAAGYRPRWHPSAERASPQT